LPILLFFMVGFELDEADKELRTIITPSDLSTWTIGLFSDHLKPVVKNVEKKFAENGCDMVFTTLPYSAEL